MNYFKKTLAGISWTFGLRGVSRLASIGRISILARILTPGQFGAFGIASLVLALLEILTETGINVFLLQEKDDYLDYVNTAWIVSMIRGAAIALLLLIAAPYVVKFFASGEALELLYLIAAVPLIRGFINPACVRFLKELRFDREFAYRIVILIVEIGVSVWVAVTTRSAVSFVWGLIAGSIVEVVLSFLVIRPWPKLHFEFERVKRVISRGKWVTGFGLFDYLFTQGDNIAVGRMLGEGALGVYRTAYSFSTLPVTEISETYYKVMFPTFVNLKHDSPRLKRAVKKGLLVLVVLMTFISLTVYGLADGLVSVLLGPNWLSAVPIVRVLAFVGLFRGLSYACNSLFVALGKQQYVTAIIFVSTAVLLSLLVPFIGTYGAVGAAYAAIIASLVTLPVTGFLAIRTMRTL